MAPTTRTLFRFRFAALALATAAFATAVPASAADVFPNKPLRVIVPVAAGGWGDISTRIVVQRLAEELGQAVVVENRTGGGGQIGIRYTKTEKPDGYTLMSTGSTLSIQQALATSPKIDAMKDFVPVGLMVKAPALIVTGNGSDIKSLPDLIAKAKAKPGALSYGSAGVGTTTHIAAEMLLRDASVQMLHVPYKGNGAAMPDVISGRVSFLIDAPSSSASSINGGLMRALAVTSTERIKMLPNVPTVAEQGLPNYSYYYWLGLFAPAGTPPDVVKKISTALGKALADPAIVSRLQSDGTQPAYLEPTEFTGFVRKDVTATGTLIEKLAIPKE